MKRILSLIFICSIFFMFSAKMDASQFNTGFRFSKSSHRYHSRSYYKINKEIRKNERKIFKLSSKIDKYKRKLYYKRMSRRRSLKYQRKIYRMKGEIRFLIKRNRRLKRMFY